MGWFNKIIDRITDKVTDGKGQALPDSDSGFGKIVPDVGWNSMYSQVYQSLIEPAFEEFAGTRWYDLVKNDPAFQYKSGEDFSKWYQNALQVLNEYRSKMSDESYNEDAILRDTQATRAAGVNPDLNGVTQNAQTPSTGLPSSSGVPVIPESQRSSFGDSLLDSLERFTSLGSSIAGLVSGTGAAVSAIQGLTGGGSKVAEAVHAALGSADKLIGEFRQKGLSKDQIHSRIKDTIFGDGSKPGLLQGYSGRIMRKAAAAFDTYLGNRLEGGSEQVAQNELASALAGSEHEARVAGYDNSFDLASGLHDVNSKLFKVSVNAAKKVALHQAKMSVFRADFERLKLEYETKYQTSLDAELAANAENAKNSASIASSKAEKSKAGYDATFYQSLDASDMASQQMSQTHEKTSQEQERSKLMKVQSQMLYEEYMVGYYQRSAEYEMMKSIDDALKNPNDFSKFHTANEKTRLYKRYSGARQTPHISFGSNGFSISQ